MSPHVQDIKTAILLKGNYCFDLNVTQTALTVQGTKGKYIQGMET